MEWTLEKRLEVIEKIAAKIEGKEIYGNEVLGAAISIRFLCHKSDEFLNLNIDNFREYLS